MGGTKGSVGFAGEDERIDGDTRGSCNAAPPPRDGCSSVRFPIVPLRRAAGHLHVHFHPRSSTCSTQHERRIPRGLLEGFADRRTVESVGVSGLHCHGDQDPVLVMDKLAVAFYVAPETSSTKDGTARYS